MRPRQRQPSQRARLRALLLLRSRRRRRSPMRRPARSRLGPSNVTVLRQGIAMAAVGMAQVSQIVGLSRPAQRSRCRRGRRPRGGQGLATAAEELARARELTLEGAAAATMHALVTAELSPLEAVVAPQGRRDCGTAGAPPAPQVAILLAAFAAPPPTSLTLATSPCPQIRWLGLRRSAREGAPRRSRRAPRCALCHHAGTHRGLPTRGARYLDVSQLPDADRILSDTLKKFWFQRSCCQTRGDFARSLTVPTLTKRAVERADDLWRTP